MTTAEIAAAVQALDKIGEALVRPLVKQRVCWQSTVVGGFAIVPGRPVAAMKLALGLRERVSTAGVALAIGMAQGAVQEFVDFDKRTNYAGTPINRAARLSHLRAADGSPSADASTNSTETMAYGEYDLPVPGISNHRPVSIVWRICSKVSSTERSFWIAHSCWYPSANETRTVSGPLGVISRISRTEPLTPSQALRRRASRRCP